MSVVMRLKVPIEMHYTAIPMGTSKVNSFLFLLTFYSCNTIIPRYKDSLGSTREEDSYVLSHLIASVAVHTSMWAVELCTNKSFSS